MPVHSPVWRSYCHPPSGNTRHSRLHHTRSPRHNQMSDQSAYICVWWPGISTIIIEQMDFKSVTCAKFRPVPIDIDDFFTAVSSLWETSDGLVWTAWKSLSHRDRLLLSTDRKETSWQPVFAERCLRPEGDLHIARYTWYHHLGQWFAIQCSELSPVCNELWVCACDEFFAIPSIEWRWVGGPRTSNSK